MKIAKRNYNLFNIVGWFALNFDGRKSLFKGFSKSEFECMKAKAIEHMNRKYTNNINQKRREILNFFKNIPYDYQGQGNEDYIYVQKPTENGYVAICYGERGNNVYVEDKLIVNYLKAKYNKHLSTL